MGGKLFPVGGEKSLSLSIHEHSVENTILLKKSLAFFWICPFHIDSEDESRFVNRADLINNGMSDDHVFRVVPIQNLLELIRGR